MALVMTFAMQKHGRERPHAWHRNSVADGPSTPAFPGEFGPRRLRAQHGGSGACLDDPDFLDCVLAHDAEDATLLRAHDMRALAPRAV